MLLQDSTEMLTHSSVTNFSKSLSFVEFFCLEGSLHVYYRIQVGTLSWRLQDINYITYKPLLDRFCRMLRIVLLLEVQWLATTKYFSWLIGISNENLDIIVLFHDSFNHGKVSLTICRETILRLYTSTHLLNASSFFVKQATCLFPQKFHLTFARPKNWWSKTRFIQVYFGKG